MPYLGKQTLMVIAPHPDDEILGAGGLIHRVKREGGKVYVLFLTVGSSRDFSAKGCSFAEERIEELEEVSAFMGIDDHRIAFPGDDFHLQLDGIPQKELIGAIERGEGVSLEAVQPTMVVTCALEDYNQDHRAAHAATIAATRPTKSQYKCFQPCVLTYELPNSAWAVGSASPPTFHVKLQQEDVDAKLAAFELYKSQHKADLGPLSSHGIQTLAEFRGLQSGTRYAESFGGMRVLV